MKGPVITFEQIRYDDLNARQKEAFNFQKVSAVLADYGFITILLASDWGGADFIAQHKDGRTFNIQLKGRLTFDKKYTERNLYVCFPDRDEWFIYPHDDLLTLVLRDSKVADSDSWKLHGGYSFPSLSKRYRTLLEPYRIQKKD